MEEQGLLAARRRREEWHVCARALDRKRRASLLERLAYNFF
jgi:hypothetical protein